MFSSLFLKTLYDRRWFTFGWLLGAIALFVATAAFYPPIAKSIDELVQSVPQSLQGVVGDAAAYKTYVGYIGNGAFGSQGMMYLVPLAIILGVLLGSSDESSRRLYQLLAQPISRMSVVWQKWFSAAVILAIISVVLYGALVLTSIAINEKVPYEAMARMVGMSWLFMLAIFTLTYGLVVAFARRSIAIALPIVWVFVSMLIFTLEPQVKWLKHIDWVSALTYYNTPRLVDHAIALKDVGVFVGVIIVCLALALIIFPRRDIRDSE